MVRLLHISDLHFGTEVPEVVEAFHRATKQLAPEVVVCTGDVTQRARPGQFEGARSFLKRIECAALIVVPGNHDVPLWNLAERLVRPYKRYERALGPLEGLYTTDELVLASINTTRRYRHKDGEISRVQVERVCELSRRAHPRQLRVVVGHHPLFVRANAERHNQVNGGPWAARVWSDAGVDLVLGGHIHLPYVTQFPLGTQQRHALWVLQAGTTVSARVRDGHPNSFNVVDWDGSRCRVDRWDYSSEEQAFLPRESSALFER